MSTRSLVFVFAASCLTLAAAGSLRSALADALWRTGRLDTALLVAPGHTMARLGRGTPADLARLAGTAPTRAAPLLDLALAAESRGDFATAGAQLAEARRRDATFPPRWTSINYRLRRGEHDRVLREAAAAAAIYEGELTALYDVCLRTGASPERIYHDIVPPRAQAQREFLELLIRRGLGAEGMPAALRLADLARPKDRDLLFDYCDGLLASGAGGQAARLWRTLPRFGAAGGRCLDWRQHRVEGISILQVADAAVRLELSGRQPQTSTVLSRRVTVETGQRYHLRALASGSAAVRGAAEWRWNGTPAGTGLQSDIEVLATGPVAELQLAIRRPPGQPSAEGALEISNIAVAPKAAALATGAWPSPPVANR